jgi:hypothetical protein
MLLPPLSLGLAAAREEDVVRSSQPSKAIGSRKPTMRSLYPCRRAPGDMSSRPSADH